MGSHVETDIPLEDANIWTVMAFEERGIEPYICHALSHFIPPPHVTALDSAAG